MNSSFAASRCSTTSSIVSEARRTVTRVRFQAKPEAVDPVETL